MDLKDLRTFVTVVDLGSFSAAGKYLYLSQPSVSVRIHNLEDEFGVTLLERTTRSIKTTPAGRQLYLYAKRILAIESDLISDELLHGTVSKTNEEQIEGGLSGAIRIVMPSMLSHYVLNGAMTSFRKKNPDVRFHIITGNSQRALRLVTTGQVDFGVMGTMIPHFDCQYKPIGEDELVVITPNTPEYVELCRGGFPMEELLSHPFITREPDSGMRLETFRILKKRGLNPRRLQITMESNNLEFIKQSVSQGLGLSIMSRHSIADFEQFGLILASPLREGPMIRPLYLAYHTNPVFSPQAEAFIRSLK